MQLEVSLPKKIIISAVIMFALIFFVYYFHVPNPNIILIVGLVLCSALFGLGGGIVSAVIMMGYTLFFFSTDFSFTQFTPQNLQKVWVSLIGIAADMILVCWLKSSEINAFKEIEVLTKQAESQKELLSALLDNMPAISFSKDAKTGAYLSCNQRFAEYANKPSQSDIIGLTDYDIFDEKTAKHLAQNDKITLSMDTPLVSYADVLDAQGNPRQLQTTEMTYLDSDGNRHLLGMSMDMTEIETFKKESARVEEERKAYLRLSALSGNLIELYYIDPETEEYT